MNSAAGASVLAASAARVMSLLDPHHPRGAPLSNLAAATTLPHAASAQRRPSSPALGVTIPARPPVAASRRAAGAPFWSMSAPAHLPGAA
jgi:hypothetical protein